MGKGEERKSDGAEGDEVNFGDGERVLIVFFSVRNVSFGLNWFYVNNCWTCCANTALSALA